MKPDSPHAWAAYQPGTAPRRPCVRPRPALALLGAALAVCALSAHATLGGAATSVEADRVQTKGTVRPIAHPAFTVQELTTSNGTVVREYVSPAGVVFGVAWQGQAMPNLRQVLGASFATLSASQHRVSGGRGHLAITEGNIVFESNGRMRAFHGRAFLSNALPAGVTSNDID